MKRKTKLAFAVLLVVLLSFSAGFSAFPGKASCTLPRSIQVLEEEAFYGTAIERIVLPRGLLAIEADAFGSIRNLREAYIPKSVESIHTAAFSNSEKVTLYCEKNSYAEEWARQTGSRYAVWNDSAAAPEAERVGTSSHAVYWELGLLLFLCIRQLIGFAGRNSTELLPRRPRDCPVTFSIAYHFP